MLARFAVGCGTILPVCSALSSDCILPAFICCRVPTLKEVLSLVNAAQRAGRTVGVAIHTLVRCVAAVPASCQCWRPYQGMAAAWCRGTPGSSHRYAETCTASASLSMREPARACWTRRACRAAAAAAAVQPQQRHCLGPLRVLWQPLIE